MKNTILALVALSMVACAHNPTPEYNYVDHTSLGKSFVDEKNVVCDHFAKSNEPLVTRRNYLAAYVSDKKKGVIVKKRSHFEVSKVNVPAWHCGETSWGINQNLSEEVALGRDVPLE